MGGGRGITLRGAISSPGESGTKVQKKNKNSREIFRQSCKKKNLKTSRTEWKQGGSFHYNDLFNSM